MCYVCKGGVVVCKKIIYVLGLEEDHECVRVWTGGVVVIVSESVCHADHCVCVSSPGKTYTMLGTDQGPAHLGVMPCAVAWLFRLINEQKDKTGARFSVRVSAVQVTGREEKLRDLLTDIGQGEPNSV